KSEKDVIDGVSVSVLYPPGFRYAALRELRAMRFALPWMSARYGRYPYRVLTVVHPQEDAREAGGMEYPTLITTGGSWWMPPGALFPEIVTVHELGHQWFYGLVGTNELRWPFLDEGINQFAEVDAMGKWRGAGSAVDVLGLTVSDAAAQAVGGNMRVHDEPVAQAANAFTTGADYAGLVYARTASILETMKRVYGDEPVLRALGRYARRFRFQHPGPDELVAVFDEVLGARAATTLRTALFDRGWVDYLVDYASSEESKRTAGMFDRSGKRERIEPGASDAGGYDNAVLVRRHGTLSFPVDVVMTMADGSTRVEHWDGEGESKRFSWHDSVALRGAVVDPDDHVLVDANLENNHAAAQSGGGAAATLERATYLMQLALQAVSP
ncbi:MAG TPA: M1 family aminopeptidase, partial [Polyangiaceae bacterium]